MHGARRGSDSHDAHRAAQVVGDAHCLPFADAAFDLVFTQCAFLWFDAPMGVVHEVVRVLQPGGVAACIEPDYGGLMESPPASATRQVWLDAIERAGGHACVGRQLPGWFRVAGMTTHVMLLDHVQPAEANRFEFLRELDLLPAELDVLLRAEQAVHEQQCQVEAHLPFWLILAVKSGAVKSGVSRSD
jgi:SAM-dependent methyltransferase